MRDLHRSGLTLVELVTVACLAVLIGTVSWRLWLTGRMAGERIGKELEVQTRAAIVFERLAREMRRGFGFAPGGGGEGSSVRYLAQDGPLEVAVELLYTPDRRLVRLARGREETLGAGLPLKSLSFDLVRGPRDGGRPGEDVRLVRLRARFAWEEPAGVGHDLDLVTAVMARNAQGCAVRLLGEVVE